MSHPSSAGHPPARRRVGALATGALATLVALALVPPPPAAAADGPAPASRTMDVISDVHTDAIATFWDDDQLLLGTKADTPGAGTRYDSDTTWFHVDDDSRVDSLPAGYEFVAPAGATVWLAPEVNQAGQIWPGFSTESVPAGVLDGDDTTLTLVDVDGPGDVELWQSGSFGGVNRIWSSDEDITSFTRKRVHMHANWAFTAAGTYRLTVRADAAVDGAPVSDTQVYSFVVGELPEAVLTTTTITPSATELAAGDPVTLAAAVSPGDVEDLAGAVEFRDGATVLGHDPIDQEGNAELTVPNLSVGTHAITAVFVPETTNLATTSSSRAATVTVAPGTSPELGIAGVLDTYQPGDVLQARVVGRELVEGQTWRWVIRAPGGTTTYVFYGDGDADEAAQGRIRQLVGADHDGLEIRARLRQGSSYVEGADTGWVTLDVDSSVEPITAALPEGPHYVGETVELPLSRQPAPGESVRLAYRVGSPWYEVWDGPALQGDRLAWRVSQASGEGFEYTWQTLRDGVVIATSEPFAADLRQREVLVQGVRQVYRVGQTLEATAEVHPSADGLTYRWTTQEFDPVTFTWQREVIKEGTGPEALGLELPMTLDLDGLHLDLSVFADDGAGGEVHIAGWSTQLVVSDAAPDEQLLFLEGLSGHYHQGYAINLALVADPGVGEGDTVAWEWLWPGGEWSPLPDASGLTHEMTAEQALAGVQVRATLHFAEEGRESVVTEPVTIEHDDHGSPARQQPTVGGVTAVEEGTTVRLSRQLPANGSTVLTGHRWEKKVGDGEWTPLPGESGADLSFEAALADDGAQFRVSVLKPTGEVAYGPSPAVTLHVADAADPVAPVNPVDPPVLTPPGPTAQVDSTVVVKTKRAVRRGAKATVKVVVRADGVVPAGQVRIKVAGRTVLVDLDATGRAKVKVRIPRSTRTGAAKVVAVYLGGAGIERAKDRATVRVTR